MIKILKKENCCGCHACYSICPQRAITMEEDKYGFKYPKIDNQKCISCGLCEKVCPILNNEQKNNEPTAYACINKDNKIRLDSSSGGIFTLLAKYIINDGGVVFGAALDENFEVNHICISAECDIEKLRKSKYVQSNINNTYKEAKKYLEQGRKVLYTGTPCQIAGLKKYLQKEYENLYTQDIICHGVPSPKVWKEYLKFRENKELDKIKKIEFRNKDDGWNNYFLKLIYYKKEYKGTKEKDQFMQSFLSNNILRDSCYKCNFKGKEKRVSDITLADFWGIDNVIKEMNDNKGTSLVFTNTKKGNEIFKKIKENIKYQKVDFEESIIYNPSYSTSSSKPKNRENFINEINSQNFDKVVAKYIKKPNIIHRAISKTKRILKKIIKR